MLDMIAASALAAVSAPQPHGPDLAMANARAPSLAAIKSEPVRPDEPVIAGDPLPPRGIDLRARATEAPEIELAFVRHGPIVLLGAFGGRYKGMPGLAHIGMIWKL